MAAITATEQQLAILAAYRSNQNLVIPALAGTGKTSTLQMLGQDRRQGLYLAFNKAIANESREKFAGTGIQSSTGHALAWRQFRERYETRLHHSPAWVKDALYGEVIDYEGSVKVATTRPVLDRAKKTRDYLTVKKSTLINMVKGTLKNYMRTVDSGFEDVPVEFPALVAAVGKPAALAELAVLVRKYAQRAWEDTIALDGRLPFSHDVYIKMWAMQDNLVLPYDVIMLDEAQDADPLMVSVLRRQTNSQLVIVGDENQAIYSWRGAIDAMRKFDGTRLPLSQSFRFGDSIAATANWWLDGLGSDTMLSGYQSIPSTVGPVDRANADAVLVRTNGGGITEVISAHQRGQLVALASANQASKMLKLAEACLQLQERRFTNHPDLEAFDSWDAVVDFVENNEDASDLAPVVRIVERFGAEEVIAAVNACVPRSDAELIVSTAHYSKGLEWDSVVIGDDFRQPKIEYIDGDVIYHPISRTDAMLAYVSMTRAKKRLDPVGLAWAKNWPGGIAAA